MPMKRKISKLTLLENHSALGLDYRYQLCYILFHALPISLEVQEQLTSSRRFESGKVSENHPTILVIISSNGSPDIYQCY